VVVASEVVERELRRGVAGCPICRFEARFEGGDLRGDATEANARTTASATASATPGAPARPGSDAPATVDAIDRLIALLGLAEPGGAVLLTGAYATLASALAQRCEVAVITDQPHQPRALEDPVSAISGFGDAIPFSDGTFRAAALGASTSQPRGSDAVRCTVRGGRVVGAAALQLPEGARELARDEREWVAEVDARATVVELKRRS
jgi:hypothetical protein